LSYKEVAVTDVADLFSGSRNSQDAVTNGAYPLFDRSSVIKRSDKYLFDGRAIIVPGEGKEFIPRYFEGKFDLHQRAYTLMPHADVNPKFVYYAVLNSRSHFAHIAVGSTVKSLRRASFETLHIPLPDIYVQNQIAGILSAIDDRITANEKINNHLASTSPTEISPDIKRGNRESRVP